MITVAKFYEAVKRMRWSQEHRNSWPGSFREMAYCEKVVDDMLRELGDGPLNDKRQMREEKK